MSICPTVMKVSYREPSHRYTANGMNEEGSMLVAVEEPASL